MSWQKIEDKITRPCTKPIQYRETHWTVFADEKLWFFGKRWVDSTSGDPMASRETSLLGAFVTVYDLKSKKWDFKSFDKVNDDEKQREHIFAVNNKIFMLIYSNTECCNRLLVWGQDNKWQDVKLENAACKECKPCSNHGAKIVDATDGVYIMCDCSGSGEIYKLDLSVQNGEIKQAKCNRLVASADLALPKGPQSHLTAMAINKEKIALWYGMEMCGFWWQPETPLYGELKPGSVKFQQLQVPEPRPPYAYGGPSNTLMFNNKWIMLGGSKACGMAHVEDCREIWMFDLDSKTYKKSNLSMVDNVPLYRISTVFDCKSGNVYVCDLENGIYVANLNSM
jgi:hypothetical protein